MNILHALAVKDIAEATRAIPVINFFPAFGGEPAAVDAVATQVRHASENVGFFYLAGHGVPADIIHGAFEAGASYG
jgi:isopenicillin N synthase-like dioxygenase